MKRIGLLIFTVFFLVSLIAGCGSKTEGKVRIDLIPTQVSPKFKEQVRPQGVPHPATG